MTTSTVHAKNTFGHAPRSEEGCRRRASEAIIGGGHGEVCLLEH